MAIVNSHYITEGQNVAIIAYTLYVYTWTKPAILLVVTNLIVILQWGNEGGEGEEEVG